MTRTEAQKIIDSYCDDTPTEGAIDRLMAHNVSDFELMGTGAADGAAQQDRLDAILYAKPGDAGATTAERVTADLDQYAGLIFSDDGGPVEGGEVVGLPFQAARRHGVSRIEWPDGSAVIIHEADNQPEGTWSPAIHRDQIAAAQAILDASDDDGIATSWAICWDADDFGKIAGTSGWCRAT